MSRCSKCGLEIQPNYKKCFECRFKNNLSTKKRRGHMRHQNSNGLTFNEINCENLLLLRVKILDKIAGHKSADMKRGFDVNEMIDFEFCWVLILRSKGKCFYCERDCKFLDYKPHQQNQFSFDRIDSEQGHNIHNEIVLSCLNCNIKKGQKTPQEFKELLKKENIN